MTDSACRLQRLASPTTQRHRVVFNINRLVPRKAAHHHDTKADNNKGAMKCVCYLKNIQHLQLTNLALHIPTCKKPIYRAPTGSSTDEIVTCIDECRDRDVSRHFVFTIRNIDFQNKTLETHLQAIFMTSPIYLMLLPSHRSRRPAGP